MAEAVPTPEQPLTGMTPFEWFEALYGGAVAKGWVEFRLLKGGVPVKHWHPWPIFEGHPDQIKAGTVQGWIADGQNVYYGVSLRKEKGVSGDAGCEATHLIWQDLDLKDAPGFMPEGQDVKQMTPEALHGLKAAMFAELMRRCAAAGILPFAVVDSGHGLQVIWKREASSDTKETEALNLMLCGLFADLGADKKTRNAERILRLPSSKNLKNPARPLPVNVWHLNPAQAVSREALAALMPEPVARPAMVPAKPPSKAAPTGDAAKDRAEKRRRGEVAAALRGEAEQVAGMREGGRNDQLNISVVKLARFLPFGELAEAELIDVMTGAGLAAGLDESEIRATLHSGIAHGTKEPADPERYDAEEQAKKPRKKATVERLAPEKASKQASGYRLPTFSKGTQEGTDEANAVILAANGLGGRLRYSMGLGWHVYRPSGTWEKDAELTIASQVAGEVLREVVGQYFLDAVRQRADKEELQRIGRWASAVCNVSTVKGALLAAAGKPEFLTPVDAWNARPDLLNCKNGVLELQAGTLRPHSPDDLMTWQAGAAFDPAAQHPYVNTLLELLEVDGRSDFIQRSVGSTLYGAAPNEVFTVLQGEGGTGKGTLTDAVVGMLGEYAYTTEVDMLLQSARGESGSGPKPELLKLQGKRLVVAGEPPKGARFNAGRVKGMTGNDPITARSTHSPVMVTFTPVFKLWIHTNYAIGAAHDDTGLQRRIRVVPFTAKPSTPDLRFKTTLKTDPVALSALLNWALEGCRLWLSSDYSLGESTAVSAATGGYWKDQNPYEKFAAQRLTFAEYVEVTGAALKNAFENWAEENGVKLGRAAKLAELYAYLGKLGVQSQHTRSGNVWVGVELSVNPVNPVNPNPQFSDIHALESQETGGEPSQGSQGSQPALAPASGEL